MTSRQSRPPGVTRGEQLERLPDADVVGQRRLLELAADAAAQLARLADRVEAEDRDLAAVGLAQALEAFDRGRLAGAVRAEQAEDLTAATLKLTSATAIRSR